MFSMKRCGMRRRLYALSLKQPWATLVVTGLKTVEIRRWMTNYRGPLLIHASRLWDARATGWEVLPAEQQPLLQLRGGVIGQVELLSCVSYKSVDSFTVDQSQHWNRTEWFEPPIMFGFRFVSPRVLPFHACKGQVRLFTVDQELLSNSVKASEGKT